MNKKICFVSTYIGEIDRMDISENFIKNKNYDYLFFTNLKKHNINNKSWEIIRIDLKDYSYLKSHVKISRYFKFKIFEILNKLNRNYDFVIYCDAFLSPKSDLDWDKIVDEALKTDFPLLQYNHYYSKSIVDEMLAIVKCGKDTIENIEKLKRYLEFIDEGININQKQFYENTVLGYSLKNQNIINFLNNFWEYYISENNPSYRDQCLWNFMYLKYNRKAIIIKSFRNKFNGKIKVRRKIEDYKKNIC